MLLTFIHHLTSNHWPKRRHFYAYRFSFNGQEKDDEIKGSGNSFNFSHRIHDPRLGRFLSIDPLTRSFAWNSPFAFAENRVIDGHDLEGKEWERSIKYDILTGQFDVQLTVQIQVVNKSKVCSDIETQGMMSAMQNQVTATFTQQDKDRGINYSAELKYETLNKSAPIVSTQEKSPPFLVKLEDVQTDANGFVVTGGTLKRPIGTTQNNSMMVSVSIGGESRGITGVARTGTHEVGGHSSGLEHPWEITSGQQDIRVGVSSLEAISRNIMNSESPKSPIPSVTGTQATPDQLLHMTKTIGSDK